jgi:DNA-directed RNA polymerase subunit RPC12/RpoP
MKKNIVFSCPKCQWKIVFISVSDPQRKEEYRQIADALLYFIRCPICNGRIEIEEIKKSSKVISHCTNPAFKGKKIKYVLVS